jgi:predicted amidohydrolase
MVIRLPGKETGQFCRLSKELNLAIVIGVNEKNPAGRGNGSIYNSLLTFTCEGIIANHHRKLVPTFTEKLVWPWVHDVHQMVSRHYAFEGRCYVVAVGQILRAGSLPAECKLKPDLKGDPDELLLRGGSCIYGPDGTHLLDPQLDIDETILFEIPDLEKTLRERMNLDVTGHYNRPDVFRLEVNRERG